jgi:hypothetical protein
VRGNLTVIALGLLAITGCAHRANHNVADENTYTGASIQSCQSCAESKPSERAVQGGSPCGGAATIAPAAPPTAPKLATTLPPVTSQSPLPTVQTAPRLPDVVAPRALADLPPPMPTPLVVDSGIRTAPGRIPDAAPTPAPRPTPTPAPLAQPQPAPTQSRNPESVQTHQVLTGTVELWRRTQRLRYSPADVEEANGGLVTLVGDSALDQLTEGRRIRVRGVLIPSADRMHPPTFQVQSVETAN